MRFCEKLKNPLIVSREANVFSHPLRWCFSMSDCGDITLAGTKALLCFANMHGTGSAVAHYLVPVPNVGE